MPLKFLRVKDEAMSRTHEAPGPVKPGALTRALRPARETISSFFGKSFFGKSPSSAGKKCESNTSQSAVLDLTDTPVVEITPAVKTQEKIFTQTNTNAKK